MRPALQNRRRVFVASIAALSLVAFGGCGESDEDKFADKGNEICKEHEPKIEAAMKEGKKKFRITGEIIRDPTNVVLLEAAEPVEDKE